ncbi:MAG: hypothetical protein DRN92_08475 [Thermoproteota archaeon]|nr:MAG: hypothetical protein DRN92_08475 [Candidatus Korarchaeota archaeon]
MVHTFKESDHRLVGHQNSTLKTFIFCLSALVLGCILNFYPLKTIITLSVIFFLIFVFLNPLIPFYLLLLVAPVFNPGVDLGFFTVYLGPILILLSFIFCQIRHFCINGLWISTPVNVPYIIFLGIAIVSMFRNFLPGVSFRGFYLLLQPFLVFFLITSSVRQKRLVRHIFYLFVTGGMLGALLGIFQFLIPGVFKRYTDILEMYCVPLYHGYVAPGIPRVNGMFGDANTYGQFLVQIIIFAFGLFLAEKSIKKKFYLLGALLICLIALGLSYSRGAWFNMLAASVLLSLILIPGVTNKLKAITVIVSMFFFLIYAIPDFTPRFLSFFNPYESSRVTRLQQYKDTIAEILEHPFLGRGVGFYQYHGQLQAAAHNIYLNIADEIGIPGLMVFLWILFIVGRDSIRFLREADESTRILVATLLSGIVAFFGHGIIGNELYSVKIGWIPGFAMGLIYSLRKMYFNKN